MKLYRKELIDPGNHYFSKLNNIVPMLSCPSVENGALPKLECVMGRCNCCPPVSISQFELETNNSVDQICYSTYVYHTKCKKQGTLTDKSTSCTKCSNLIASNMLHSPEKITRRKEISLMQSHIYSFHRNVYIPAPNRYKYHIFLVSIMSKNHCKKWDMMLLNPTNIGFFRERLRRAFSIGIRWRNTIRPLPR